GVPRAGTRAAISRAPSTGGTAAAPLGDGGRGAMARRRDQDRTIDSDPATQGALSVPKTLDDPGDPSALHEEPDVDRMLDRETRSEDEADVHLHERPRARNPADPLAPEDLAADALTLVSQGGGSLLDEDDEDGL